MKQTVIFTSNSPLDGYRTGDGDLMDNLTTELNQIDPSISAVRIIADNPSEEIPRLSEQLVIIDNLPEITLQEYPKLHFSQQKIVQFIDSYPALNKVLYVGSRIDNFRKLDDGKLNISVGSGALYTEELLLILKRLNVKVVVCCLEVVFHTRSLFTSFRLYEMLRNHLQHADLIHYLTQRDQHFVKNDLQMQLGAGKRLVHPDYPIESVEPVLFQKKTPKKDLRLLTEVRVFCKSYFESSPHLNTYFSYFDDVTITHIPSFYAPGVTVHGLTEEEINSTDTLMNRPHNILVFGLIRSHKGIEEGLALGQHFNQKGLDSKVYIIGKILGLTSILKVLFQKIFDEQSIKEKGVDLKSKLSECKKSTDYNKSFQALYDELMRLGVTKRANVELVLDASEAKLLQYSQCCRYALKFDVKGFAENASSMISSMIGLALPVIAQRGFVTPFLTDEYGAALHLIEDNLQLIGSEIMPRKVDVQALLPIFEESDDAYLARIRAIQQLRASKRFDIKTTAQALQQSLTLILPPCTPSSRNIQPSYYASPSSPALFKFPSSSSSQHQPPELADCAFP